ncbi:MAG: LytTR family transcriptional regulator DNA-binding domain-containing protein [bacterium]|nr:LytTR family transcriptional regulator DNA-binding domain-containing protein [bacterium]
MALYIAICDDHVADRKQLERLLDREKDNRLKSDLVLYIDSFGSSEALLNARIRYGLLLIDVTNGLDAPVEQTVNGMDIAKQLRSMGMNAPIALCSSSIDYTAYGNPPPDHIIYLTKPISQGQLSHLIDVAIEQQKTQEPLIEIRGQKDTCNVTQTEILYAVEKNNLTDVIMTNARDFKMLGKLNTLIRQLSDPTAFAYCGKDCMINFAHVTEMQKNAFVMDNKDVLHFPFIQRHALKEALLKYQLRHNR